MECPVKQNILAFFMHQVGRNTAAVTAHKRLLGYVSIKSEW